MTNSLLQYYLSRALTWWIKMIAVTALVVYAGFTTFIAIDAHQLADFNRAKHLELQKVYSENLLKTLEQDVLIAEQIGDILWMLDNAVPVELNMAEGGDPIQGLDLPERPARSPQ